MTIDEIKSLIDDTVDTDSTTFPDARKVRGINKAQDKLVNIILENDSLAQWDDVNYEDLNEGYLSLVANQSDYDLKEDENLAETLYIVKILAKDGNGTFVELEKIGANDDKAEAGLKDDSTGSPKYYRVSGKTVLLSPTPDYASSNGLKVIVQRKPEAVKTVDTTKELGIPSTFHFLVALEVSYDYARAKRRDIRNDILSELREERERLGIHISNQDKDMNTVMTTFYESSL